jgi:AraC-like DNA-binding protein
MALVATLTRDRGLGLRLNEALSPRHQIATARSLRGFTSLIRERPVTIAMVDLASLAPSVAPESSLTHLRQLFPHLALVLIVRRHRDAAKLFLLGRAGIQDLVLLALDDLERGLKRTVSHSLAGGGASLVVRALSPYLPRRELMAAHLAMDSVHLQWTADEFAAEVGLSRPFMSERFKAFGLPSVGHFLLWARLFHAGHWLTEPGRTGESISRQLEYSSGAAFRRALRHYTGATPTRVRERGGLPFVLSCFLRQSRLERASSPTMQSVA